VRDRAGQLAVQGDGWQRLDRYRDADDGADYHGAVVDSARNVERPAEWLVRPFCAVQHHIIEWTASPSSTAMYGQCGGSGWSGCTTCVSGATCTFSNNCADSVFLARATNANMTAQTTRSACRHEVGLGFSVGLLQLGMSCVVLAMFWNPSVVSQWLGLPRRVIIQRPLLALET
jgi:hypothetical protein